MESLLGVIMRVKSFMVSGRQAARLPQRYPAQGASMRTQSFAHLQGAVAILAGVAVLAFSCTPIELLKI